MKTIAQRTLIINAALTAVLVVGLAGCNYRVNKGSGAVAGTNSVLSRGVGFDEVETKVLKVSCMQCHATTFPHLDTYASVKPAVAAIKQDVFVTHKMPKTSPLPADQAELLFTWIQQGAPEVAQADTTPPPPVESGLPPATWANVRDTVVNVSCASCHFAGNPDGRIDLTDVQVFKASIGTILYTTLVEKEAPMPPITNAPLTVEQKRAITEWVIAGQPEE